MLTATVQIELAFVCRLRQRSWVLLDMFQRYGSKVGGHWRLLDEIVSAVPILLVTAFERAFITSKTSWSMVGHCEGRASWKIISRLKVYILQTDCTVFLNDLRMQSNAAKRKALLEYSKTQSSKKSALRRAVGKPQRQGEKSQPLPADHNIGVQVRKATMDIKVLGDMGPCWREVRAAKHSHKFSYHTLETHSAKLATF